MKDPRINITYDFEGNAGDDFDSKEQYARPILDGDNENYYGFGYDYDEAFPLFVDGLEVWEFFQLPEEQQRLISSRQRRGVYKAV